MMTDEILERLHPSLRSVIESELKAGNSIRGAESSAWTNGQVFVVSLAQSFTRRYDELADIRFLALNDPHYWGEEWSARQGEENQVVTSPYVVARVDVT